MEPDMTQWSSISFEDGRRYLRRLREDGTRRSEEVIEIWEHVLSRKPTSLDDELWLVYEQVCIAALDCSRLDVAQECLDALHQKFPRSSRVLKLEAMRLEAIGKFDDALKYYDSLIRQDESNCACRKRKVAVYKAKGQSGEAIRELCDYLKLFMNDVEGWLLLSELYLKEQDIAKAAHCFEEVLLNNPQDHVYLTRFAEIKYTQGGIDNVETAKAYFCEAAKLNAKNVRALYGILVSCSQLTLAGKATGQKRKDLFKTASWAAEQLIKIYTDNGNVTLIPEVEHILTGLQVAG